MTTLRREVQRRRARLYCPAHPAQALLCAACDIVPLPEAEMDELADLLEQAGFLDREPFAPAGVCWRCHGETLACLAGLDARDTPGALDHLEAAARDRLYALTAKLVPPWLSG